LERWAQEAIKKQFDLEVDLTQIKGRYVFRPSCLALKPLEVMLNRFVSAKNPEQERFLFEHCKNIFHGLIESPQHQRTKRFREIVSFVRVFEKEITIGKDLSMQLQSIADSLGCLLESFSYSSSETFLSLVKHGISPGRAFSEAVSKGMSSLSLDFKGPAQGFFFGFDFMLCASSLEDINRGDYEIILSDVNIFPGGFEIFIKDKSVTGKLAKKSMQLLVESMKSLTDKNAEINLLNDWEALNNNQRWRERIKTIIDCLNENKINTQQIPYYPADKNHRKRPPSSAFWFVRQGFFPHFLQKLWLG